MSIPPVSRRQFLATGTALARRELCAGLGRSVPAWRHRRCAARRGGRGGAGARGGAGRLVRRHPHQPLSPRVDRDARAAGAERVALDELRPRPARAGQRRVGLRRDQPRRARRGPRPPRNRRSRSPAPTPCWPTRKVVLANADKVVTTWTSAFKRDPFEVPLETKIAFLMKLNETALAVPGVSFVNSQMLFVDEQKYFASSEGSRITQRLVRTYPQFTHHRRRPRQRRLPDARRRRSRAAGRLRVRRGLSVAAGRREGRPRGGREAEGRSRSPPGRYDIVVDPSQLFLAIHESVGHSTELDRSLGWEANMAGTSFLKPSDAGKLRFGANDRQPGRRSHAARRPGDDRLSTTRA